MGYIRSWMRPFCTLRTQARTPIYMGESFSLSSNTCPKNILYHYSKEEKYLPESFPPRWKWTTTTRYLLSLFLGNLLDKKTTTKQRSQVFRSLDLHRLWQFSNPVRMFHGIREAYTRFIFFANHTHHDCQSNLPVITDIRPDFKDF